MLRRMLPLLLCVSLASHEPSQGDVVQFSTIGALAEGVYTDSFKIQDVLRHGNVGLGTFTHLDGEMVILDGRCYQIRQDGSIHQVPHTTGTPFALVTPFKAAQSTTLTASTLDDLYRQLDRLRGSNNQPFAFRAQGHFRTIRCRSVAPQPEGRPLVEAVVDQRIFDHAKLEGTLVGFWFPSSLKGVNVAGYHFHFLDASRSKAGGHVLELASDHLTVEIQPCYHFEMQIPTTPAFHRTIARPDQDQAIHRAERNPATTSK